MIELINRLTGTTMWVAEERLEEYLGRGHKLASPPPPAAEPAKEPEKPKKKVSTKKK